MIILLSTGALGRITIALNNIAFVAIAGVALMTQSI